MKLQPHQLDKDRDLAPGLIGLTPQAAEAMRASGFDVTEVPEESDSDRLERVRRTLARGSGLSAGDTAWMCSLVAYALRRVRPKSG